MALSPSSQRNATGLASATSANGTTRSGASQPTGVMAPGTLSVQCTATIVTGSVVATFTPQVSMDGTTWYDVKASNNGANVALSATGNVALALGQSIAGWTFFRCNALLSGATTAAGDLTTVTYRWVRYGATAVAS